MAEPISLIIGSVIGGAVNAVSDLFTSGQREAKAAREAQMFKNLAADLQDRIQSGQLRDDEIIQEFSAVYDTASNSIRSAFNQALTQTFKSMDDAYKSDMAAIDLQMDEARMRGDRQFEDELRSFKEQRQLDRKLARDMQNQLRTAYTQRGIIGGALAAAVTKMDADRMRGERKITENFNRRRLAHEQEQNLLERQGLGARERIATQYQSSRAQAGTTAGQQQAAQQAALRTQQAGQTQAQRQFGQRRDLSLRDQLAQARAGQQVAEDVAADKYDIGDFFGSFLGGASRVGLSGLDLTGAFPGNQGATGAEPAGQPRQNLIDPNNPYLRRGTNLGTLGETDLTQQLGPGRVVS